MRSRSLKSFPPVLLLNHADHLFWFGPSISHAVLNLRDAAKDLAQSRRGIAPERNLLLPTIVDDTVRVRSRSEAKQALGFDPERILLVSVARSEKYRTMNGITYADLHVRLLRKYPEAHCSGRRIPSRRLGTSNSSGRRPDLPSVKAIRSEALLRGGRYIRGFLPVRVVNFDDGSRGYGLPLVTIFKAPDAARIFAINHVGLVGRALVAKSDDEYVETLSRLISDETFRTECGEAARDAITKIHASTGWLPSLEAIYTRSMGLPPLDNSSMLQDDILERPFFGEPDRRHEEIFRSDYPLSEHLKSYMGMVPGRQQWAYWRELRRSGAFANSRQAFRYLLPEWLKRVLTDPRLA